MSRNPLYQKLLNSKRWHEVKKIVFDRTGGLCERCREEGIAAGVLPNGYMVPGVDCHHIMPVESVKTEGKTEAEIMAEMERIAYDVNNIRLLCVQCHIKTHREMKSHQWQMLKKMPRAEETDTDKAVRDFVRKVSDGKQTEIKPRPKPGVRRTPYGWMTAEDFEAKKKEQLDGWAANLQQKFTKPHGEMADEYLRDLENRAESEDT